MSSGKKTAYKKSKEIAWKQFSIYIRTRDCIRFCNSLTEGICVTCKRSLPFKKLQAGHFIGGRSNIVLFDERIVYTQCFYCNAKPPRGLGGNYVEYFVFMEEEWGRAKIDEFRALKGQIKIYKDFELLLKADHYKEKTAELVAAFKAKSSSVV